MYNEIFDGPNTKVVEDQHGLFDDASKAGEVAIKYLMDEIGKIGDKIVHSDDKSEISKYVEKIKGLRKRTVKVTTWVNCLKENNNIANKYSGGQTFNLKSKNNKRSMSFGSKFKPKKFEKFAGFNLNKSK